MNPPTKNVRGKRRTVRFIAAEPVQEVLAEFESALRLHSATTREPLDANALANVVRNMRQVIHLRAINPDTSNPDGFTPESEAPNDGPRPPAGVSRSCPDCEGTGAIVLDGAGVVCGECEG